MDEFDRYGTSNIEDDDEQQTPHELDKTKYMNYQTLVNTDYKFPSPVKRIELYVEEVFDNMGDNSCRSLVRFRFHLYTSNEKGDSEISRFISHYFMLNTGCRYGRYQIRDLSYVDNEHMNITVAFASQYTLTGHIEYILECHKNQEPSAMANPYIHWR